MTDKLNGCVLAMLIADGVDGRQVEELRLLLRGFGARIHIVSPHGQRVLTHEGRLVEADGDADAIHARYYDALVVPGGLQAARDLVKDGRVRALLEEFQRLERPVAGIAEGVEVLLEAGLLHGRRVAAPSALREVICGRGGECLDRDLEADRAVVTGRPGVRLTSFAEAFAREVAAFRQRDWVEETSIESFPASDSPGGNAAI